MKPTITLILSAIAFAVIWSGWVVVLSDQPSTVGITAICGSVAGFLWYRIMRWCFRRMRLLPAAGASAAR